MWKKSLFTLLIVTVAGFGCSDDDPTEPPPPGPPMVTLEPSKDNTLYEDPVGTWSNAQGQWVFVGQTNGPPNGESEDRRALIAFDIAGSVPAGATIDSVFLTLELTKRPNVLNPPAQNVRLHRLQKDWGEGTSNAISPGAGDSSSTGDATWIHNFFDTGTWNTPGGDYSATTSAGHIVDDLGSYTWGSALAMVSDVQLWLDTPASNFGWILIGDETQDTTGRQFGSRENITAADRPKLKIFYTP